jgi:hypothetical protein
LKVKARSGGWFQQLMVLSIVLSSLLTILLELTNDSSVGNLISKVLLDLKLQPMVKLSLILIFVSVEVEHQTLLSLSQPTTTFLSAMDTMKYMSIAVLKSLTSVLPIPTIKI